MADFSIFTSSTVTVVIRMTTTTIVVNVFIVSSR